MADLSDVGAALVNLCAGAVYPTGTSQPSITGSGIRLFQGWPVPQQLDADLAANVCQISVYPRPEERNTTRYPKDWMLQSVIPATITATITGQTIMIGGAFPSPFAAHNVMAMVNNKPYVYTVLISDTINSIATALAALIAVDVAGTVVLTGTITLPNSANLGAARVGVNGSSVREIRRQEKSFQITVWANTPAQRDVVSAAIDVAMAATEYLAMPDGFGARLIYKSSMVDDRQQKDKLYRRDFFYSVEYATTQTEVDTQITQEQLGIATKPDASTQYTAARITYL